MTDSPSPLMSGVQFDRGLYGPLIVEDPAEPAPYDQEWTGMTVASPSPSMGGISGMPGMNMASPSPSMSGMPSMGGRSGGRGPTAGS